jgi:hypothetical protein
LPSELTTGLSFSFPGSPAGGGSDNAAFACFGAPGFGLGSESSDYGSYTWHTGLDTFDKAIAANLRRNATLTAMLAYLASEDPVTVPRDQRVMSPSSSGEARSWPSCTKAARSSTESTR